MMLRLLSCVVCLFMLASTPRKLPAANLQKIPAYQQAVNEQKKGNFKNAFELYKKLLLSKNTDSKTLTLSLPRTVNCLRQLNRISEFDALLEESIVVHQQNWRFLDAASRVFQQLPRNGVIIDGIFIRGPHRGGRGKYADVSERDRVRALQLMVAASALLEKDKTSTVSEQGGFYSAFANIIQLNRGAYQSWKLQVLTDLTELPEPTEGHAHYRRFGGGNHKGAAVDEEGNPLVFQLPESWKAAASDGERWRWILNKMATVSPEYKQRSLFELANWGHTLFGVQTLRDYPFFWNRTANDSLKETTDKATAPYQVHTLNDEETLAKLATGIKRFQIPKDYSYITLYQQIANAKNSSYSERALNQLENIYKNRRQYPRAVEFLNENIKRFGPGNNDHKQKRLEQIIGNWGEIKVGQETHLANRGAKFDYRFRNGTHVDFEAYAINVDLLLKDCIQHLKSNPNKLDRQRLNFGNIGYELVNGNQKKYLGRKMANWSLNLKPLKGHYDKQQTVTAPLNQPGAYFVTATMQNGNKSRVVLWVNDTLIMSKSLNGKRWYMVADAETGEPVSGAHVEFIGYRVENRNRRPNNKIEVFTQHFAEYTDKTGQVSTSLGKEKQNNFQWLAIARTQSGRLAHLGFQHVWHSRKSDPEYSRYKTFFVSDRPVYKPKDSVKYKFWIRNPRYDDSRAELFANQEFEVQLIDPQGKEVFKKKLTSDAFGGLAGEYQLPEETTLGTYWFYIVNHKKIRANGSFRVEEYKKPEYEVTIDSPTEPVQLGDKITATIKANYYFGAPVQNAKVHYTVKRSAHSKRWFPVGRWDWLYGNGYWWFAEEWDWYPGWKSWGCVRPYPYWWPSNYDPPEVVLDQEVEIGSDGTVKVEFDTALAKAIHGDQDHRYEITAEVVDESRRTIVGTGSVLVARKPFEVTTWVNRGYYRAGDKVNASVKIQTLDQKPVQGTGILRVIRIKYTDQAKPIESLVEAWEINPNELGEVSQTFRAAEPGQYRLQYNITDTKGNEQEAGTIFNVYGSSFTGQGYTYNDLELLVEQKEYKSGDKVKLRINTNRTDATVLLFVRPVNGVYEMPYTLKLNGKSTSFEIDVIANDMPNFFVEAVTISRGEVHQVVRNVFVPPTKRVMNLEVTAEQPKYQPGEEAKLRLKLTDLNGNPVTGSVVLTAYDKSVDYIAGNPAAAKIREFFWDFKRNHHASHSSSWSRPSGPYYKRREERMQQLGLFGHLARPANVSSNMFFSGRGRQMKSERAAPMAAAPLAGGTELAMEEMGDASGQQGENATVAPKVRSDFADTAFWAAALTPDENGIVTVSFPLPDSLTTWGIKSWSMGEGTRVGYGETEIVTSKNLLVRLQAPRFFVEQDEVVLSANVHSYLDNAKSVKVVLELDGEMFQPSGDLTRTIELASGKEQRVDWRVKVLKAGEATIRMLALTDEASDAVEMKYPVYLHGAERVESYAGTVKRDESSKAIKFEIPDKRIVEQTRLDLRFSPSLAAAMVDALPYLVNYPHKTTDTTVHRFVPTVITFNILKEMGIDLEKLKEKQTNLNSQELGDPETRAAQWKRYKENPVFDSSEVERIVKQHVKDLTQMQLSDGGWGWLWGYGEHSSPHMTAQVVHGLLLAQKHQVALVPGMLDRGLNWLETYQNQQVRLLKNWEENQKQADKDKQHRKYKSIASNIDALVFGVLVEAGKINKEMHRYLNRDRVKLSAYSKGLLGLALHQIGDQAGLELVLENLEQYLQEDAENETAWLNLPEGSYWWHWYGDANEANAVYLKLLTRTNPKSERAARLVKYILNNRKHSTYWNSTRDTALAIEALAEYLAASGEMKSEMLVEVWLDGKKQKEVQITPDNLFEIDNSFTLEGSNLSSGLHTLELRKTGSGPLYYNMYVKNFSQADFLKKAGLELKVERRFSRLIREDKETVVSGSRGQAVGQRTEDYRREPLVNSAELKSGDLIEVELIIESKNDYEYLIFEDFKAAGLEPVDLRSGYTGNSLGAYMQFKNEKVTFYVNRLARGKHAVTYRLRAEIPGRFSALPAQGSAMYAPELRSNSDEMKLQVQD